MPTVHCSHRGPRGPVKREEEEDRQRIPNYLQDERAGPWVKRRWKSRPSSQLRAYYQEWREARKHFYVSWHSINLTTRNQAKFTMVFMPIIRRGWWERKKKMSSDSETPKENQFLTLLSAQGSERGVSSSLWPALRLASQHCLHHHLWCHPPTACRICSHSLY